MSRLFAGTPFERPVTCEHCGKPLAECGCPRDAKGGVLLPGQQTAVVRVERRAKGKAVTIVEGLDPSASDLKAILKALKDRCAAGGTVGGKGVEVQGEHRDAAADVLRGMGYRVRVR